MRLWSLHPRYLDARGLVAAWREALLAQAVLAGRTRGYREHPQLVRFRSRPAPGRAIAAYLRGLHAESVARGYRFAAGRIADSGAAGRIARCDVERIDGAAAGRIASGYAGRVPVTRGQIEYEQFHLLTKLRVRDPGSGGPPAEGPVAGGAPPVPRGSRRGRAVGARGFVRGLKRRDPQPRIQ